MTLYKMNTNNIFKKGFCIILVFGVFLSGTQLQAQHRRSKSVVGGAVEGALIGGVLGNIFGDKKDGRKAAKIGAILGALGAADKQKKERERQRARRRAEQMRIEQERLAIERQRLALAQQQAVRPLPLPSPPRRVYSSASSSSNPKLIKNIERSLVVLGYMEPPVTGVTGPKLNAAIKIYQRVNKITVDGLVTQSLLNHLEASGG